MDKFVLLKAIAITLCTGMVGSAIAGDTVKNVNIVQNGKATTAKPNDVTILNGVKSALADYAGQVSVFSKSGVVFLSGQIATDADYNQVITVAESVKGVSDVNVDKLTVKESFSPLYDAYLNAKIQGFLIQSNLVSQDIPAWSFGVETKDGCVILTGKIATQEEKQKVLNAVKAVSGVSNVNDKIEIGVIDAVAEKTMADASATTSTEGGSGEIADADDNNSDGNENDKE